MCLAPISRKCSTKSIILPYSLPAKMFDYFYCLQIEIDMRCCAFVVFFRIKTNSNSLTQRIKCHVMNNWLRIIGRMSGRIPLNFRFDELSYHMLQSSAKKQKWTMKRKMEFVWVSHSKWSFHSWKMAPFLQRQPLKLRALNALQNG